MRCALVNVTTDALDYGVAVASTDCANVASGVDIAGASVDVGAVVAMAVSVAPIISAVAVCSTADVAVCSTSLYGFGVGKGVGVEVGSGK